MKLSQKRTCTGCRALILGMCELRCKTAVLKRVMDVAVSYAPMEPCYKPMTNSEYIEAFNLTGEQS